MILLSVPAIGHRILAGRSNFNPFLFELFFPNSCCIHFGLLWIYDSFYYLGIEKKGECWSLHGVLALLLVLPGCYVDGFWEGGRVIGIYTVGFFPFRN